MHCSGKSRPARLGEVVRDLLNQPAMGSAPPSTEQSQQADAYHSKDDSAGLGHDVGPRIRAAEENLLRTIVEVTHADIEQHDVVVVEAVRINVGKDGVVGEARSLVVDWQVIGGLRVEVGD